MKKLLAAFILLLASALPALAQCPPNPPPTTATNKAAIIANITSCFADNTTGAITPAITRGMLTEMVNSWQQYNTQVSNKTGNYTVVVNDYGQVLQWVGTASVTVTLPAATGAFSPFNVTLCSNIGPNAGVQQTLTATAASGTIINQPSIILNYGDCYTFLSDGANWWAKQYSNIFNETNFLTWAPFLSFGGATTGIAYAANLGWFFRSGPLTHVTFQITLNNKGSATGVATVQGLPYAAQNGTGVCPMWYTNMTNALAMIGIITGGTNFFGLYVPSATQQTQMTNANFNNNSQLYGACMFLAN
jgi:hypothetical protein